MSSRSSSSVSKPASTARSSSSAGSCLALTSRTVTLNCGLLGGQLGRGVVLGEGDRDVAVLAADRALELLLEAGHEPAGAELDHLVAALAAGERHAVHGAGEVHHHEVAALGLAVDGVELGRALAQLLQLLVDHGVLHAGLALLDLEPLVLAELGLRAHADLDRELQRLALLGELAQVHVRLADRDDARVVDRRPVPDAERFADRLVDDGLTADALDDDWRGRLTGTKARDADVAGEELGRLGHTTLDLGRADFGVDAYA